MASPPAPPTKSSSTPTAPTRPPAPAAAASAAPRVQIQPQTQAEHRVRLGYQLFKAAEARIAAQQDLLGRVRESQTQLREQVQQDVAKSLQSYDQWVGQMDERFTRAMRALEQKVEAIEARLTDQRAATQRMTRQAQALLSQSPGRADDADGSTAPKSKARSRAAGTGIFRLRLPRLLRRGRGGQR